MPPVVQSRATKVVTQTDFANVVGSETSGFAEVEVTRDADGVMRFYSDASVAPNRVVVLDNTRGNPIIDIASTTLTTGYSVELPENTLTNYSVRVTIEGYLVQNSGADQDVKFAVRLDGTNYLNSVTSIVNDADPRGFVLTLVVYARGTDLQGFRMDSRFANAYASSAGYGGIGSLHRDGLSVSFAGTRDESTALDLDVQACFVTSATSSEIRFYSAITELLPAA